MHDGFCSGGCGSAGDLIGKRWSVRIVAALVDGRSRFGEVRAAVPGISGKVLAERLRELEAEGVVERIVHATHPVVVEYRLTEKGEALRDVLVALEAWSRRFG